MNFFNANFNPLSAGAQRVQGLNLVIKLPVDLTVDDAIHWQAMLNILYMII